VDTIFDVVLYAVNFVASFTQYSKNSSERDVLGCVRAPVSNFPSMLLSKISNSG